jgi:hypothetical protein
MTRRKGLRCAPTRKQVEKMWKALEADKSKRGLLKQALFRVALEAELRTIDSVKNAIRIRGISARPTVMPISDPDFRSRP